jgi:hypothetical protein
MLGRPGGLPGLDPAHGSPLRTSYLRLAALDATFEEHLILRAIARKPSCLISKIQSALLKDLERSEDSYTEEETALFPREEEN